MRRKRFQKGTVGERKHGRKKVWVGQWWENGSRRSKVLGKVSEITKTEAEGLLSKILRPINGDAAQNGVPIFTFGDYVNTVYLPTCRERWKESTRMTSEPVIQQHLCSELGPLLMAGIKRPKLQAFLKTKAPDSSRSLVEHLRWHLSGIFKMAMADGVVDYNPAGELFVPECKPEGDKLVMTAEQIRLALSILDLRARLIFRLAVFEGMRPGEIFGIRLGKILGNALLIDKRIYRGKADTPKGRKGKKTSRTIAISVGTLSDLELWTSRLPNQEPEALLFPSERNTPMWRDNVWYRSMQPTLEAVGLGWATFQVLRRTNASLGRKAKVDDKVAADQRGHGLGVSLEVYSQSDLKQKSAVVEKIESEVIR